MQEARAINSFTKRDERNYSVCLTLQKRLDDVKNRLFVIKLKKKKGAKICLKV